MIARISQDLAMLKKSGGITAAVLSYLAKEIRPGITTRALNAIAQEMIMQAGGTPSFLGYRPAGSTKGYPAAICTSVNYEAVHGVPSGRVLQEGDIVGLDVGVNYQGYFTDAATTVGVGRISQGAQRLIRAAKRALREGIAAARAGNSTGDIGSCIERAVREEGYAVIPSLTGHGVGRAVHEEPHIFNYGRKGHGPKLEEGLVIAIEPIIGAGSAEVVLGPDGFVYNSADKSLVAHEEHTVIITREGPLVLTAA